MRTRNSLKKDLLLNDFLFDTKQLKQKLKTELVKVFYKTNASISKSKTTEDKCLILQEKTKKEKPQGIHML